MSKQGQRRAWLPRAGLVVTFIATGVWMMLSHQPAARSAEGELSGFGLQAMAESDLLSGSVASLRIMTRDEGVWGAPQTIDASGSVTGHCALTVTPAGDLPVSYRCSGSGELWYAGAQEPRQWSAARITAESDDVGRGLAAVRQGSDDLALAFRNQTDGSLLHMRREGGAWTPIETVDAGPNRGQYCDLAYRPGVGYAFSEYASDGTFLAFADPEVEARFWRCDALDHYDDVGRQLSMVVGPLGRLNYTYLGYDSDHGWHIRAGEYLPDSVRILRPVADSIAVSGTGHVFPDIFLTPGQNWFISFRNAVDQHLYFAMAESLQIIPADVAEPTQNEIGSGPIETRLVGAQPNPAAGRLRIYYTAAVAGPAEVRVMDPGGRVVRHVEMICQRGGNWLDLDAGTASAPRLAAGVYFVRLRIGTTWLSPKRLVLTR